MAEDRERMEELLAEAQEAEEQREQVGADFEHFYYDSSQDAYWDTRTGRLLKPNGVDSEIPQAMWTWIETARGERQIKPHEELRNVERGQMVSGRTWWPGEELLIHGVGITDDDEVVAVPGMRLYNSYRAPNHENLRDDKNPDRWIDHVKRLYPDPLEHETFFDFTAHAIQRPHEKCNFHPILSGKQGIGKDLILSPLRKGVGEWNTSEVDPDEIFSAYTPYLQAVLLVINEAKPLDGHYASGFYNKLKPYLSNPPNFHSVRRLYMNPYKVRDVLHVVLTTNDPLTVYIPPEDRRLFVMHSNEKAAVRRNVEENQYFRDLWDWMRDGGDDSVIRWLLRRDLSGVDFGMEAPMTEGKELVQGSTEQRNMDEFSMLVEEYVEIVYGGDWPDTIFAQDLNLFQREHFSDRRSKTVVRNKDIRMMEFGYVGVRQGKTPKGHILKWRNKTQTYQSAVAYVSEEIPAGERRALAAKEVLKRPLDFGILAKVAEERVAANDRKSRKVVSIQPENDVDF